MMGGEIKVKSTFGKGSKFSFDILVEKVETVETKTIPSRQVISLALNQPEYRILVVDDHWESRHLLLELFSNIGFVVQSAENGREAINTWSIWKPHLICMDMQMPIMDGYEATKQIKSHPQGKNIIIIALTASAFTATRTIVLEAGCDDFISKPFSQDFLLEKVGQYLGVNYIFASEQENIHKPVATELNLREELSKMPLSWINEIYQASCEGDDDRLLKLLNQAPTKNDALLNALKNLAVNFRFDKIIELIHKIGNR
ncbi:MAG: response regulator [Calothrix sp. SM1_7_51]|nr:response regulator [Calothrix sp. SM1_7_51]